MPKRFLKDSKGVDRWMDENEYAAERAKMLQRGTRQQAKEQGATRVQRRAGTPRASGMTMKERIARSDPGATDRFGAVGDVLNQIVGGFTMGTNKRAYAAMNALTDRGDFSANYAENLKAEQAAERARSQRSGIAGTGAEILGSVLNPIGLGNRALKTIQAIKGAKALGPAAAHALGGAAQGLVSGAVEGAARAPDWTDLKNVGSQALQTGLTGAGFGLAMGPLTGLAATGANKVMQKIGARTPSKAMAQRVAGERTARALSEADLLDEMAAKRIKPGTIESRVSELNAQGAEPRLADTHEFFQGRLRALTDKGTAGTEEAKGILGARAARRAGRTRREVGKAAGIDPFYMSKIDQQQRNAARLAEGKTDYAKGGLFEGAVKLPPDAQRVISKEAIPTDPTMNTFKRIYNEARESLSKDPTVTRLEVRGKPTRRVIDTMMRIYKDEVDTLFKSGKSVDAVALKNQMQVIREQVRKYNPRYARILDKQAKAFAWERASKEGELLAKDMIERPEVVLDRLNYYKGLKDGGEEYEAVRSALLSREMARIGADKNSTYMQNLARRIGDETQPSHRALWNQLFKGNEEQVRKFINMEGNPIRTDQRLLGSQTSGNMARQDELENMTGMAGNVGRLAAGAALGKPAMAAGGFFGTLVPGMKHKLQERATAEQRRQMQIIMRRMYAEGRFNPRTGEQLPSSLTRMQARAAGARAARTKLRAGRVSAGGKIAGHGAGKLTEQDKD